MRKESTGIITFLCMSIVFFICSGVSCSVDVPPLAGLEAVKITTYNIQTFFDAVTTGNEYDEFKGAKSLWSEEKYKIRVQRLCTILEQIDSDIFVFQEIENASILQDISNNLKTQSDASRTFSHGVFASSTDGSLGCAVLSRFPILSCTSHQTDYRHISVSPPETRPLLELKINCGFSSPLTLFAGHWKSKSGGSALSGAWRSTQESVLGTRISLLQDELYIFCGDCNMDISEFNCDGENVLLGINNSVMLKSKSNVVRVVSPWLSFSNTVVDGSYYYQHAWEKIDHFFVGRDLDVQNFVREDTGIHVTKDHIPLRYMVWNGDGYSDHLPLSCSIGEKK